MTLNHNRTDSYGTFYSDTKGTNYSGKKRTFFSGIDTLEAKACQSGLSVYFTTMEDLIRKLRKDHETGRSGRGRSYFKSALVVVDEVGYTPINRQECNLFYRFVANRYEKASTILTSSKAFNDWSEPFHDPVIVTAILDRLLHHSVFINIRGNSFRLRGKISKDGVEAHGSIA